MKRLSLITVLTLLFIPLFCQVDELSLSSYDRISFSNYPGSPMLLEAGPEAFYLLSSSWNSTVYHPELNRRFGVDDQVSILMKYGQDGIVQGSNVIFGGSDPLAWVYEGRLTVFGSSFESIIVDDEVLNLESGVKTEYLASFNEDMSIRHLISIWDMLPDETVNSKAVQDPVDGSIYVYGFSAIPLELRGFGNPGKDWANGFIYVIKYDVDLDYEWVYLAGFEGETTSSTWFRHLDLYPNGGRGCILSGLLFDSEAPLLFGSEVIEPDPESSSTFLLCLDAASGNQQWFQQGKIRGNRSGCYLYGGFAMTNGDMVFSGVTVSGYYSLGEMAFEFPDGDGYANHFIFRLKHDGSPEWQTSIPAMGTSSYTQKKALRLSGGLKSANSRLFQESFHYDAFPWKEKVLYLTGTYNSSNLELGGEVMRTSIEDESAFITSIDLETGGTLWGYPFSSRWLELNGFDADGSGNVCLMGRGFESQDLPDIGGITHPDTYLAFLFGLDFEGNPLWFNQAYLNDGGAQIVASDLEVLEGGEVFASFRVNAMDGLNIGGSSLATTYPYNIWITELGMNMMLGGKVSLFDGTLAYPGYVKAYKSSLSGAYPLVDSVAIGNEGDYLFDHLYPGFYVLLAEASTDAFPHAVPTYSGNQPIWNLAQVKEVDAGTKDTLFDIVVKELAPFSPKDGSGLMMGNVSYADNYLLKSTLGRPVKKTSVALLKRSTKKSQLDEDDDFVAYIETDENGNYIFDNVPPGDYWLIVDIPGLNMKNFYSITIIDSEQVTGLDYVVEPDGINTISGIGVRTRPASVLSIYPNPGSGTCFLQIPGEGECVVRVFATDGRVVASENFVHPGGLHEFRMANVPGMYTILLDYPGGRAAARYQLK